MRFSWTLCSTGVSRRAVTVVVRARVCSHVRWAEDCAVPVGHEKIIALVQAVRACLCSIALLLVESVSRVTRLHACMYADCGTGCMYRLRDLSRPSPALPAGGSYAVLLHSWFRYACGSGGWFWVLVLVSDNWERLRFGIGKMQ